MIFKYCPICSRKLELMDSWDEGVVPYCPTDDILYFDIPKTIVLIAVIRENKILLLKQSYIYKNSKVLISGYVTNGESLEETAVREVLEETGIKIKNPKYIGSYPMKEKEFLFVGFIAEYVDGEIVESDEVEHAEWIDLKFALDEMNEDTIGKEIVKKILESIDK